MVIYQLFQGAYVGRGDQDWKDRQGNNCHFTWDNKKKGDFVQLRKKLDYIQSLGVNTIELLPVNEYNWDDYIGYAPVSWFAIESSYGGAIGDGSSYDDLKAFINDAHNRGISVIADVVFNHFGIAGESGPLWNYDSSAGGNLIDTMLSATSDMRAVQKFFRSARSVAVPERVTHVGRPEPGEARWQHMGRPSKLTDAQKAEARRRRAESATLKELAQSYDVGLATISRLAV